MNMNNYRFVEKYHFLNDSCQKFLVAKVSGLCGKSHPKRPESPHTTVRRFYFRPNIRSHESVGRRHVVLVLSAASVRPYTVHVARFTTHAL